MFFVSSPNTELLRLQTSYDYKCGTSLSENPLPASLASNYKEMWLSSIPGATVGCWGKGGLYEIIPSMPVKKQAEVMAQHVVPASITGTKYLHCF
jgi:hypothetical protein